MVGTRQRQRQQQHQRHAVDAAASTACRSIYSLPQHHQHLQHAAASTTAAALSAATATEQGRSGCFPVGLGLTLYSKALKVQSRVAAHGRPPTLFFSFKSRHLGIEPLSSRCYRRCCRRSHCRCRCCCLCCRCHRRDCWTAAASRRCPTIPCILLTTFFLLQLSLENFCRLAVIIPKATS